MEKRIEFLHGQLEKKEAAIASLKGTLAQESQLLEDVKNYSVPIPKELYQGFVLFEEMLSLHNQFTQLPNNNYPPKRNPSANATTAVGQYPPSSSAFPLSHQDNLLFSLFLNPLLANNSTTHATNTNNTNSTATPSSSNTSNSHELSEEDADQEQPLHSQQESDEERLSSSFRSSSKSSSTHQKKNGIGELYQEEIT